MSGEVTTDTRGARKVRRGKVVSKSGDKTIIVQTERRRRHAMYGKVVRHTKKFHAHDADNAAKVGDEVVIVECRPLSRLKHWRLMQVVAPGQGAQQA